MCPLPICCYNDTQKCEWKIVNTEETQRKITRKKLQFENTTYFSWIFYKHNIHNSCDLCYDYLVNPQTLNDARRTFFKHWLVIAILGYFQLFLEAGSKFVQFYTKFKVIWVLFLRRNVLVCGDWYCSENQYSKSTVFVKNPKEEYGYYGFSINSLPQHQTIYKLMTFLGISLWICRIGCPEVF